MSHVLHLEGNVFICFLVACVFVARRKIGFPTHIFEVPEVECSIGICPSELKVGAFYDDLCMGRDVLASDVCPATIKIQQ